MLEYIKAIFRTDSAVEQVSRAAPGSQGRQATEDPVKLDDIPPGYIRYFVSYSNSRGFGCIEIGRQRPIQSFDDVLSMNSLIRDTLRAKYGIPEPSVVILNWQRFEDSAPDGASEPIPADAPQTVVLRLVS